MFRNKLFEGKIVKMPARLLTCEKISCVYKISFSRKFYFGSTNDLRFRIYRHFSELNQDKHSKLFSAIFKISKNIKIDILFESQIDSELRERELEYILRNKDNGFMINVHQVAAVIKVGATRINQYLDGALINTFKSINEAAACVGIKHTTAFSRTLKLGGEVRGFVFRALNELGEEIITHKPIAKKRGKAADKYKENKSRIVVS